MEVSGFDAAEFDPSALLHRGSQRPAAASQPTHKTTLHTHRDGFSYASVEVSGFDAAEFDPSDLLHRVSAIFRPGTLSVSLSVDAASRCGGYAWGTLAAPPGGYGCQSATAQVSAGFGSKLLYPLRYPS